MRLLKNFRGLSEGQQDAKDAFNIGVKSCKHGVSNTSWINLVKNNLG